MKDSIIGTSVVATALCAMVWASPAFAQIDLLLEERFTDFEQRTTLPVEPPQESSEVTAAAVVSDFADKDVWFANGTAGWSISGNVGFSHGGPLTRKFGSLTLGIQRGMTGMVGPGWLRGKLTAALEFLPAYVLSQESTTYAVGFNLLARHYFGTRRSVRPFVTFGAGMLVSEDEIPTGTANLNFTPQVGAGIAIMDASDRLLTIEYRLHHLSNGGRVDVNPGINSSVLQFGITFLGGGA